MNSARETAQKHIDSLAKPQGSLGLLEEWAVIMCAVQQTQKPEAEPMEVAVFCGDHGIKKAEGTISPFPAAVTVAIFKALAAGISGAATLTRAAGASMAVVDCGIDGDVSGITGGHAGVSVLHKKVAQGTSNFLDGEAMTQDQLQEALAIGKTYVQDAVASRNAACLH